METSVVFDYFMIEHNSNFFKWKMDSKHEGNNVITFLFNRRGKKLKFSVKNKKQNIPKDVSYFLILFLNSCTVCTLYSLCVQKNPLFNGKFFVLDFDENWWICQVRCHDKICYRNFRETTLFSAVIWVFHFSKVFFITTFLFINEFS